MTRPSHPSRHARWAVPAAVVAMLGGTLAPAALSAAAPPPPRLPARTAGQLLAALADRASVPPLYGTISETASLGLPSPPPAAGASPLQSLLAGSNTIRVWYADPAHYRLELPQRMKEFDLIRNGGSLWLWDSAANQAVHAALPPDAQAPPATPLPVTPQQAAEQALAKAGPTTTVTTAAPVTVAGRPAYQLVLAPKSGGSLIGTVRIAIDSARNVPLRVQVYGKDATAPAFSVGYSSVSFARPSTRFAFRPPAGATVLQGQDRRSGNAGSGKGTADAAQGVPLLGGTGLIGSGWLAVADLPESSVPAAAHGASKGGRAPFSGSDKASAKAPANGPAASPDLDPGAALSSLERFAEPVRGAWGSGRLLRTGVLSVLFTGNGHVLAGAVAPDVLYQAVGRIGKAETQPWRHVATRAPGK